MAGHDPAVLGRHESGYYEVSSLDIYGTRCQNLNGEEDAGLTFSLKLKEPRIIYG
jgi:hypothetical protein